MLQMNATQTIQRNIKQELLNASTFQTINQSSTYEPNYDAICKSGVASNFSVSFQICIYVLYCLVFVVALCGNGLVCFVVQSSPRMKTVTNYFIVNLAVGDILMTLFCVPFSFVSTLVLRYWPFGALMCRLVNYSQAVSVLVSAYTLLAISIDRYMVIMSPLRPRLGKAAAKSVVAAVWLGALATAAPIPIVSVLQRPTPWHEACELDICGELWENVEQSEQYTWALLVLQFVVPLGALVCTYARIAHAVWGGRPPGEAESARDSRMQRSKRKMIKMMVTVVAVFTICWLPLNVFIVLYTAHAQDARWNEWPGLPYVWFASHWLAMSHSCYNPIIYCYMNARYRNGFKQVLGSVVCFRMCAPMRWQHRPASMCDGVAMSGPETAEVLPIFHVLTGCDTVSYFIGRGKKSAFDAWNGYPEETCGFKALLDGKLTEADTFIQKFIITMYDRSSPCTKINDCRKYLFTKKDRQIENIPPTEAALRQHTLRATYQGVHDWGQALVPLQKLPSPSFWGWRMEDCEWTPVWSDLPDVASVCLELTRCRCKKGCKNRCNCIKRKLKCTELCMCAGNCGH